MICLSKSIVHRCLNMVKIANFSISKHNDEIKMNLLAWERKPLLRKIYRCFYEMIASFLCGDGDARTTELGSGIGNIKEIVPNCIRTDMFENPWIDQVENAYKLTFSDSSLDNIILIDVFHHLRYPQTSLSEMKRVLKPGGRVVIFEPCMSLLGLLVYGLCHHENLGLRKEIEMTAPASWTADDDSYYAAQANASRIFGNKKYRECLDGWKVVAKKRLSAISYIASGGYSKSQMYPDCALGFMKIVDKVCDLLPLIFATRLLVVLEKNN